MASNNSGKETSISQRKTRRSWFDTPPLTSLDPPSTQKTEPASKRQSLDAVETLTLTHFTNPPRIIFGKTLIGKTKIRTLLLRNPHDFEQEVIIERFPYKKKFMVNQTRFTVAPEDVFSLQIIWTPEEGGGFREMIQFHVNDVYRLQAFVIGSAEKPKPPKKPRKFPVAPYIRHHTNVVQTSALSSIKTSYSPNGREEVKEVIEYLASCPPNQNEDKENSINVIANNCRKIGIEEIKISKQSSEVSVNETITKAAAETNIKLHSEEEILKTPNPLESTTIAGKNEVCQAYLKNRRQWRIISDITSPTLNMSPIPVNEGNEHGITVDSYFQPNETNSGAQSKPEKVAILKKNVDQKSSDEKSSEKRLLKDTLVLPLPPVGRATMTKTCDGTITLVSSSVPNLSEYCARADETRIVEQHQMVFVNDRSSANTLYEQLASEYVCSTDVKHSKVGQTLGMPPKTPRFIELNDTSEVSPRTLLDQSLTLISQTAPTRSTNMAAMENNPSINSHLISEGQCIVSPNSFMEDMKSLVHNSFVCAGDADQCKNSSTPDMPTSSVILNNSVPHSVIVNHLQSIRSSLHGSPLLCGDEWRTPKKSYGARLAPKRRSISSQFQKEELRKIATAARTVKKCNDFFVGDHRQKFVKNWGASNKMPVVCRRPNKGTLLHSQTDKSPQGVFLTKKEEFKKTVLRSPKGRRSPRRKSPLKNKVTYSKKNYGLRRVNNRSPVKPYGQLSGNRKSISSLGDSKAMSDLTTPQTGYEVKDTSSDVTSRTLGSDTVIKCKSHEDNLVSGGRLFNELSSDEVDVGMTINISSIIKETIIPDIHIPNNCITDEICHIVNNVRNGIDVSKKVCDSLTIVDDKQELEQQQKSKNEIVGYPSSCTDKNMNKSNIVQNPGHKKLERIISMAENSISPQNLFMMSPSNLPTSPGAGLDLSRRGTITVTKSRPSDSLLAVLNNRKKLFNDSPKKTSSIMEGDTETVENIQVKVEEHYKEIDGKMYLIVRETTDVIKSTLDTYIEEVPISPHQFETPTRLPNSPDLLMSRRSTHVVRSPKVINVGAFNKRQINFPEKYEKSIANEGQHKNIFDDNNQTECDSSRLTPHLTKSDTFEKEPTLIASSDSYYLPSNKLETEKTACIFSPKLVAYEDGSESGSSRDVTKDSLDTSQSVDSLISSPTETNVNTEKEQGTGFRERNTERENKTLVSGEEGFEKRIVKEIGQSSAAAADQSFHVEDLVVKGSNHISNEDSEDEQFYDTMSERYYDALSEAGNEETEELNEVAESHKYNGKDIFDSEVSSIYKSCQSDCSEKHEMMPLLNEDVYHISAHSAESLSETLMSHSLLEQHFSIDHSEHFQVIEREVISLSSATKLKPLEVIVFRIPEGKVKRKLHRSFSIDTLLINQLPSVESFAHSKGVGFSKNPSNSPTKTSSKNYVTRLNSAVVTKSTAQNSSRYSPVKVSKVQIPTGDKADSSMKQRSKSLSNLCRQVKSPDHNAFEANNAHQTTKLTTKQQGVVTGVAQGRLILVKKPKRGIPRHPMLFAARNMYYDERWMEKQERGFVQWLNFVLTPPDEHLAVTSKAKVDARYLTLDNCHVALRLAPTKEILSCRAYVAHRRLNRLRRSACELYQSESFVNIIRKIEVEVESRRISVRKDRMIHADLGIKQKLLDLLLHYSSLWLRIGLETIFGEVLMLPSNQDVMGLSRFIVTRLLLSPDIAAEFAHPTVPHLYKDGYVTAVSCHFVKKFLLLIYFLDHAKSSRLIDHDPCLFCKDAGIKSSKEILIEFSREVLSGEGDITRHLAYLGYTVSHTQKPIDEFDFAVKNLSSDLRDGLRLCRVLELLAGDNIMAKLRVPAISRLQKIHNTEVSFKVLNKLGLDLNSVSGTVVTARDIVDGHREKTLSLLWQLIIHFQSSIQVNETHLKEEIDILTKSLRLKIAMQRIGAVSIDICQARRDSGATKLIMENRMLKLILQWSRLVCLHYGIKVENFTVSFSDGRALCCLLHHYHPALLPLAEIQFQTSLSLQEEVEDSCQADKDLESSLDWGNKGGGFLPDDKNSQLFEQLLANEKLNFKTLQEKVSALGGVPLMLKFSDMSNTIPDEKVVSTYVSYLCARLLDIREEVRAARFIQMAWRRKQLRKAIQKRQRRTKAAVAIQRWIRTYLIKQVKAKSEHIALIKQDNSSDLIVSASEQKILEAVWRDEKEMANFVPESLGDSSYNLSMSTSKQKIQETVWRDMQGQLTAVEMARLHCEQCLRGFEKTKDALSSKPKLMKGLECGNDFLRKQASAIKIQAFWKGFLAQKTLNKMKQDCFQHRKEYIEKSNAVIVIQKNWRMRQAILTVQALRIETYSRAAITIQKHIKAWIVRAEFLKLREAVVTLQSYWRIKQAKKELHLLKCTREKKAAVLIQNFIKSALYRQKYLIMKRASILIQRNMRKILSKRKLIALRAEKYKAAVMIQKNFRRYKAFSQFQALQRSATILQNMWRTFLAKKKLKYLKEKYQKNAATVIQRYYRGLKCRQEILKCRASAIKIQKTLRMHRARKLFVGLQREQKEEQVLAATTIQRIYKGYKERKHFTVLKFAIVVLQKNWRMIVAMRITNNIRQQKRENAAMVLQRNMRRWKHRHNLLKLKAAVIVLQNTWRVVRAQKLVHTMRLMREEKSAILIQKLWRGYLEKQMFTAKRRAAVKVQSYWKMFNARQQYSCMREATLLIQAWHRANIQARRQRLIYLTHKESVSCIQRWWRCCQLRERFLLMRRSAVIIQARYQGYRCRQTFVTVRHAAVIIQGAYRQYLETSSMRKKYLANKQAAVTIQKSFRRYMHRKQIKIEAAALVLQTVFRKVSARRTYLKQKLAAQTIQRRYRQYKILRAALQNFQRQRQAACVIQRAYKTHLMRKRFIQVCHSVIQLQAQVRGRIIRNHFNVLRESTIIIQRKFRAVKMACVYRKEFLQLRSSAVIIQNFYRAVQARRKVQQELAHKHLAAAKVQAVYRGWSQRQDFMLLRSAAVCIQRRYRAFAAGQTVRNNVKQLRISASAIQKRWRFYRQVQNARREVQELREMRNEMTKRLEGERLENEKRVRAAIVLQRSLRKYTTLKDCRRREHAALMLQKNIRSFLSRRKYDVKLKKIYKLQQLMRGFAFHRRFARMKLATRIIQIWWREIREGRLCRAEFVAKRRAAVIIQSQFAMIRQRKLYQNTLKNVIIVQANIRMFLERTRYKQVNKHLVYLQRKVRNNQQMRKDRDRFFKLRNSAIKIQSVFRLWLAYRHIQQENSQLKTHKHLTMHQQLIALCHASQAVESQRLSMELTWQKLTKGEKDSAVLAFHTSFQKYLWCQADTKHLAANIIQSSVKYFLLKRSQVKNSAALIIQKAIRRYISKRRIIRTQSTIVIQSSIRQFLWRRNHLSKRHSVVVLQAAVRGWLAKRLASTKRRRCQAAICLQAGLRGFLVRKKVSPLFREQRLMVEEQRKQLRASIRIQAMWRGFVTRRRSKDNKLILARRRLEEANKQATKEKTLGSRTSSALDYLLREKDLAHILEALMNLEVSTRLSSVCCDKMAEVNAVPVLYHLINSCNRSIPHMELIKYAVKILLNLAKYEKTIAAVIEPQESVSSIVDLLQIYREKGTIFNNSCLLLGILGLHPDRRMQILRHPLIVDRLQSIHALALRKLQTHQNRQVTQAKMSALRSFNCSLPVFTPSKARHRRVQPEWSLGGKIKDFDNPVVAVMFVMDALQIRPKV